MPNLDGILTPKEQKVVDADESAQPELGALAQCNTLALEEGRLK
jgi:hypothetical protein